MHALQSGKWNDLYIVSMNMKLVEVYHVYLFSQHPSLYNSTCDVVSCIYKCGACSCLWFCTSILQYPQVATWFRRWLHWKGTTRSWGVLCCILVVYTNLLCTCNACSACLNFETTFSTTNHGSLGYSKGPAQRSLIDGHFYLPFIQALITTRSAERLHNLLSLLSLFAQTGTLFSWFFARLFSGAPIYQLTDFFLCHLNFLAGWIFATIAPHW